MAENGFDVIEDGKYHKFSNGIYETADLHEGNIGRTGCDLLSIINFMKLLNSLPRLNALPR